MRILGSLGLGLMLLAPVLAPARAVAADYRVVLDQMAFGPVPPQAHVGDTIIWQNKDIFRHSATAQDGSFDVDLPAHSEARMTVTAAGTIVFYCKFHPDMTGQLVVMP
ncbi:MAG TPA: cupredoxin domain-containing protein [Devosiaceae bacterium]|jgi:plastocyanin